MYLQKYGVKRFPYRGRRRCKPSINQYTDGGIVISNDVFGLTIKQFERMYIECLDRRKTQEQWIVNLRYPDKSSKEYLEYLQNCIYYNKGSDIDLMSLLNNIDIIQNVQNIKHPIQHTTMVMESDNDHPGFTRLRLIAVDDKKSELVTSECCESTTHGLYLSVKAFLHKIKQQFACYQLYSHGPCLSNIDQNLDFTVCLCSKNLPCSAIPWARRHRHQWPPNFVIEMIEKYGCFLVPIGPKTNVYGRLLYHKTFGTKGDEETVVKYLSDELDAGQTNQAVDIDSTSLKTRCDEKGHHKSQGKGELD
ncbi:unnamed protein product [Mytilus coruscus]|uniref:Uncharacterized protein n=1 Tax=Mytilus coruscus TaxID=42192 RepID=A0A6J8BQ04_MYTCO|nr:unnamed protein product [Mytilus coruscus]